MTTKQCKNAWKINEAMICLMIFPVTCPRSMSMLCLWLCLGGVFFHADSELIVELQSLTLQWHQEISLDLHYDIWQIPSSRATYRSALKSLSENAPWYWFSRSWTKNTISILYYAAKQHLALKQAPQFFKLKLDSFRMLASQSGLMSSFPVVRGAH